MASSRSRSVSPAHPISTEGVTSTPWSKAARRRGVQLSSNTRIAWLRALFGGLRCCFHRALTRHLKDCYGVLAGDVGKIDEEFGQRIAGFEVVEQSLDRNA